MFPRFYDRLEKFYSEHAVWRKYSVEEGYDTIDAIIAYGNKNQPSFVKEFSCTRLTREDEKKKKSKIIAVWLTTIAGMTGIVLIISLQVSIASEIEQRKNEARTAAVLEKLQAANTTETVRSMMDQKIQLCRYDRPGEKYISGRRCLLQASDNGRVRFVNRHNKEKTKCLL